MISIIAAIAKNRVIGSKNGLPWHLPADFKYFKEKTQGKIIILGLNTFKSIGERPLPNRKHIILCDKPDYKISEPFDSAQGKNNCFLVSSIDKALEVAKELSLNQGNDEVMICGGAFVYKQFLPLVDRLYLTYIHQDFEGDTCFPEFNIIDFKEVSKQDFEPDEKNKYSYSFVVLDRI